MQTMNIHISLKFHAVCAASKVLQNYNDLGLKDIFFNYVSRRTSCRKCSKNLMFLRVSKYLPNAIFRNAKFNINLQRANIIEPPM